MTTPAHGTAAHGALGVAPAGGFTLAEMERRHIAAALELGISVKTLYRKIRRYGLQRPGGRGR